MFKACTKLQIPRNKTNTFIHRSCKMVVSLMSLWAPTSLICTSNVEQIRSLQSFQQNVRPWFGLLDSHDIWPCQTRRSIDNIGVVLTYTRSGAKFCQFCDNLEFMWRFINNQRRQGCSSIDNSNWLWIKCPWVWAFYWTFVKHPLGFCILHTCQKGYIQQAH
jgi:hypothetical protein